MTFNLKGMTKGTAARILGMLLVLVNLIASSFFNVQLIPYAEEDIYEGASVLVTVVMGLIATWKNNSLTKEAQIADAQMKRLKK